MRRRDLFHGGGKLRARVLGESQHRLPQFYITSFQLGIFHMSNAVGCFMLLRELQSFFLGVAECESQVFRLYSARGLNLWAVPALGPHTCGCWESISAELPEP